MQFLAFLSLLLIICIGTIFGTLADEQVIIGWTIFHPVILGSVIFVLVFSQFLSHRKYYGGLMILGGMIFCGSLIALYFDTQFRRMSGYSTFGPVLPSMIAIIGILMTGWAWKQRGKNNNTE